MKELLKNGSVLKIKKLNLEKGAKQ